MYEYLITKSDKHATTSSPQFSIEYRVENRVIILDILHQQRVTKPQCALEILSERVVQEARLCDLLPGVLVHNKLCCLTRWIDDQRISEKDEIMI